MDQADTPTRNKPVERIEVRRAPARRAVSAMVCCWSFVERRKKEIKDSVKFQKTIRSFKVDYTYRRISLLVKVESII